ALHTACKAPHADQRKESAPPSRPRASHSERRRCACSSLSSSPARLGRSRGSSSRAGAVHNLPPETRAPVSRCDRGPPADQSARPRRQLRDLFGRVSLHDGQKQRLAFFRPQRTEGTAELAVLQNVGPIPIQSGVIAFTSLPFVIEREEKDLTIPSTAIDEPV